MAILFLLILITFCIIMIILGLVDPKISMFWNKRFQTRVTSTAIYTIVLFMSFIVLLDSVFADKKYDQRIKAQQQIHDNSTPLPSTVPEINIKDWDIEAQTFAKQIVMQQLKSPSTAEFTDIPKITLGFDSLFMANGFVDSQNSYGAMVRSNYYVRFRLTHPEIDDWEKWTLISVDIKP